MIDETTAGNANDDIPALRLPPGNRPRLTGYGLRAQVIALVMMTLFPLIAFFAYELYVDHRRAVRAAMAQAEILADNLSIRQMQIVEQSESMLQLLSSQRSLQGPPTEACTDVLEQARSSWEWYSAFVLISPDGRVQCSHRGFNQGIDVRDRLYFNRATTAGHFVVGEYMVGRITGRPTLAVALPVVLDGDDRPWIFSAGISTGWVEEAMGQSGLPDGSSLAIASAAGTPLLRYPLPTADADGPDALIPVSLPDDPGDTPRFVRDVDGVERFMIARNVDFGHDPVRVYIGVPTDGLISDFWDTARQRTAIFAVIIILAAAWLYRWMTTRVIQPARRLMDRMEDMRDGRGVAAVRSYPDGEIGILARQFDQMVGLVDSRTRDLERTNEDLTVALQKAETARLAAHAANVAKTDFLATTNHEVRTPLTAIIGFSEMLCSPEHRVSDSKMREYARYILEAGTHLRDLMADLIDLARLDTRRLALERAEVAIPATLRSMMRMVGDRARRQNITVVEGFGNDLPVLWADLRMFRQMVLNLLVNAVKYTRPGGSVTLSAVVDAGGTTRIIVADTGIGMDSEDIPRALEPYQRLVDPSGANVPEGSGLGLALVKRMIDLHGGALEIESALGQGTTATLVFPPWTDGQARRSDAA